MVETSGNERDSRANKRVIVVGGGLAGLAAATILAERGRDVVVIESEAFLGGRVGAWADKLNDGTEFQMERGFHAFFRQYYNLRALIRRVDPDLKSLVPMDDYPLLGPNGATQSFSNLPKQMPLNILELLRRTPTFRARDLLTVSPRKAAAMMAFDPQRTYARWDRTTAAEYLDSLHFPEDARRMLFDVFAHSFFNPEGDYSAAELLAMFHFYFLGNPEGLVFDTMNVPFSRGLFEPLARHLQNLRTELRLSEPVLRITKNENGTFVAETSQGTIEGSELVLAVSIPGLKQLVKSSPTLFDPTFRANIDRLTVTLPFAVWRLWYDKKVNADRPPFAGTSGLGCIDNISVFEKLEDESRAWSERNGGSVVELHAYAVDATWSEQRVREDLMRGLHAAYPETRTMKVLEERFLLRQDCPAFRPGDHASRPGVETAGRGVYLAGDFVKLPWASALMERAVTSGFMAANAILTKAQKQPVEIKTIKPRGFLAGTPGI